MSRINKLILSCLFLMVVNSSQAADTVMVKNIGMELGHDLVKQAVLECRKEGYQVSAVVVDRNGIMRAALRDDLAARFTLEIAQRKANTSIMSGIDSGDFLKSRQDIRPELNHVKGLLMVEGGVIISAGGYKIGALGVSGAPGGDKDAACAKKAIKKLEERIEFAQ